jgi:hypothetical protein
MNRYHFHTGHTIEAKELVERHHYSRLWPSNIQLIGTWHDDGGLFGDSGSAIAACVFAYGARGWTETVLDLVRLVRHPDHHPQLSGLISQTARMAHRKGFDVLVSYADATHDHHGGVYQAASWNYHGMRKPRVDALIINGVRVPNRTVGHQYGSNSIKELRQRGYTVEESYDLGKHLYWKAHGKSGHDKAQRLGLATLPYPKPDLAQPGAELPTTQ